MQLIFERHRHQLELTPNPVLTSAIQEMLEQVRIRNIQDEAARLAMVRIYQLENTFPNSYYRYTRLANVAEKVVQQAQKEGGDEGDKGFRWILGTAYTIEFWIAVYRHRIDSIVECFHLEDEEVPEDGI